MTLAQQSIIISVNRRFLFSGRHWTSFFCPLHNAAEAVMSNSSNTIPSKPDITAAYSALQGLFWLNYCIIGGFANVYLLEHNFSNSMIGAIVALSGIFSACISPLVAAYADKPENAGKTVVVLLPDSGDRYYSTPLFTD